MPIFASKKDPAVLQTPQFFPCRGETLDRAPISAADARPADSVLAECSAPKGRFEEIPGDSDRLAASSGSSPVPNETARQDGEKRRSDGEHRRRRRDSNPRDACAPNGFQIRRHQPLGHASTLFIGEPSCLQALRCQSLATTVTTTGRHATLVLVADGAPGDKAAHHGWSPKHQAERYLFSGPERGSGTFLPGSQPEIASSPVFGDRRPTAHTGSGKKEPDPGR
jgi:hypothetical protein